MVLIIVNHFKKRKYLELQKIKKILSENIPKYTVSPDNVIYVCDKKVGNLEKVENILWDLVLGEDSWIQMKAIWIMAWMFSFNLKELPNIEGKIPFLVELMKTGKYKNTQNFAAWLLSNHIEERSERNEKIKNEILIEHSKEIKNKAVLSQDMEFAGLGTISTSKGKGAYLLINHEKALPELIRGLITTEDIRLRGAIISALNSIGSKEAIEPLKEQLNKEENKEIKAELLLALAKIERKESKWMTELESMEANDQLGKLQLDNLKYIKNRLEINEKLSEVKLEAESSGMETLVEKVSVLESAISELVEIRDKVKLIEGAFEGEKWQFIADKAQYIGSIEANKILISANKTLIEANSRRIDSTQKLIGVLVAIISMLFGALFTLVFTI